MPSWPWFAALCVIVVATWLIYEFRRAPLQEDPHDREQFAQGSLGECWNWWHPAVVARGCQRWAIVTLADGTKLCGHCLRERTAP